MKLTLLLFKMLIELSSVTLTVYEIFFFSSIVAWPGEPDKESGPQKNRNR